jgi:alkanesulfonate monooxygenase SsuD/methylene tetrahydromethanopterin reductase-like flavin-dependent oxidoreductase (luciferase family)
VNGVGWMYCAETNEEAQRYGGAAAFHFMRAASHLAGVGAIYPSPAYGAQASAIQLRQRPGDVAGPVRQGTPIGSPDTVIRALKEWESIGVDRMVFLINYDQVIPQEKILTSLRLFAEQVMPAFKEPEKPSLTTTPALDLMRAERGAVVGAGAAAPGEA